MRRRISWLVVATTSAVVVSFVIPLCLLVRTLAEDRAMAAADQEARNVAILVAGCTRPASCGALVAGDRPARRRHDRGADRRRPRARGRRRRWRSDPDVRRARAGEAFTVVDAAAAAGCCCRWSSPDGTAVVRATVTAGRAAPGRDAAPGSASSASAWSCSPLALVARLPAGPADQRAAARGGRGRPPAARGRPVAPGPTSAAPRRPRSSPGRSTGSPSGPASCWPAERAAVGDLSHRLRTPVTALRLDAEAVADPELAAAARRAHRGAAAHHRRDRAGGPPPGAHRPRAHLRRRRGGPRPGGRSGAPLAEDQGRAA